MTPHIKYSKIYTILLFLLSAVIIAVFFRFAVFNSQEIKADVIGAECDNPGACWSACTSHAYYYDFANDTFFCGNDFSGLTTCTNPGNCKTTCTNGAAKGFYWTSTGIYYCYDSASDDVTPYSAEHYDYYDMHEVETSVGYADNIGNYLSEIRTGFKNVYDINDSKVECHSTTACSATDEDELDFPTTYWGDKITSPLSLSGNSRFRVFVPPGTVRMSLYIMVPSQAGIYVVASYKNPPDCLYCDPNLEYSTSIFNRSENTYTLEELDDNDVYLTNAGGHITIFDMGINPSLAETQDGWLYVDAFVGEDQVQQIIYTLKVNPDEYRSWYDNYDWNSDPWGLN